MGRQVDQDIDGVAPDGDPLITKQVHQQRHGRRTDPPDDFKRPRLQAVIVEESPHQRQRTPRPLNQVGFGACADLRVPGRQAMCPVEHPRGARGKIRTLGLARLRECTRGLRERWYRQKTKQRADEQVSHGRSKTDEEVPAYLRSGRRDVKGRSPRTRSGSRGVLIPRSLIGASRGLTTNRLRRDVPGRPS